LQSVGRDAGGTSREGRAAQRGVPTCGLHAIESAGPDPEDGGRTIPGRRLEEVERRKRMWLAREPGAGSGERGAGIKRAGSKDCRKKSRNR
jgi:hypothetical protein